MTTSTGSGCSQPGSKGFRMFAAYLSRWDLTQDGEPVVTPSSCLVPVLRGTAPAMLKVYRTGDEAAGGSLMDWWSGDGAAMVIRVDRTACLMERAAGFGSLSDMSRSGQDDDACRILCSVAARLHAKRSAPPPGLVPLASWFSDLDAAAVHGGMLARCAETARALLAEPRDVRVLHGDLHHGNVLDFGVRGWLAIDPKGLVGERSFDVANLFLNPDLAGHQPPVATDRAVFRRRLDVVAAEAALPRDRLLRWIMAWSGLSAIWLMDGGVEAPVNRQVAELAAIELAS